MFRCPAIQKHPVVFLVFGRKHVLFIPLPSLSLVHTEQLVCKGKLKVGLEEGKFRIPVVHRNGRLQNFTIWGTGKIFVEMQVKHNVLLILSSVSFPYVVKAGT